MEDSYQNDTGTEVDDTSGPEDDDSLTYDQLWDDVTQVSFNYIKTGNSNLELHFRENSRVERWLWLKFWPPRSCWRERILSFLSPDYLLSSGLLVCRQWKSVVEVPAFWSWSLVRLDRNNFQDIFTSPRFSLISSCWLSYPLLTSHQITHLLQWLAGADGADGGGGNLTQLELCGDLSEVRAELVSRAVVTRLECLDLIPARLSQDQLSLLLTSLATCQPARLRLRELRLSQQTNLSLLEPDSLVAGLLTLERLSLAGARLTGGQVSALLAAIAGAGPSLALTELKLDDVNLSSVPPRVLARAVLRLEVVSLNGSGLTEDQLSLLFTELASQDKLRVRELYVQRGNYYTHGHYTMDERLRLLYPGVEEEERRDKSLISSSQPK